MYGYRLSTQTVLILCCFLSSGCTGFFASKLVEPIKNGKMSQVSHEGVTLHYVEVGDKQNPPLIFLHGILAFTQSYSEFIERLAEKYFVVGIDMRGHGRSTIGTKPYSHKLLADDVILVADESHQQQELHHPLTAYANMA